MEELLTWYVNLVSSLGYLGIFIMTIVESTILPIPSEITMIPAGYLIYQGKMSFFAVLISSTLGTLMGSLMNYYIASRFGRHLVITYGKYVFFREKQLEKVEKFFIKHGSISTFTGRLVPGVRHLISFVAGLSKMDLRKFSLFTSLGGGLWMLILIITGRYIGENQQLIDHYGHYISTGTIIIALIIGGVYFYVSRSR